MKSEIIKIFIGSSSESREVVEQLSNKLNSSEKIIAKPWWEAFTPSRLFLEDLVDHIINDYDFAIFLFHLDDIVYSRNEISKTVRDNVLFEFGLFNGNIGRDRCFILKSDKVKLKEISDLKGLTTLTFNENKFKLDASAALQNSYTTIVSRALKNRKN